MVRRSINGRRKWKRTWRILKAIFKMLVAYGLNKRWRRLALAVWALWRGLLDDS